MSISNEPDPAPKSKAPVTLPARIWTVSAPDPSRISPWMVGVIVVLELAIWERVTPVVLALRSRAMVLPVGVEVVLDGLMTALIRSVFSTLTRLPDRSTMA